MLVLGGLVVQLHVYLHVCVQPSECTNIYIFPTFYCIANNFAHRLHLNVMPNNYGRLKHLNPPLAIFFRLPFNTTSLSCVFVFLFEFFRSIRLLSMCVQFFFYHQFCLVAIFSLRCAFNWLCCVDDDGGADKL